MLVTSKSKIAPKNRLTIPRLELNGAVLAKRLKEFVTGTLDLNFENIYHMVDSSTVLGYIHKPDSKLKPFEGIRVSEIQTSGIFEEGRLRNWSWIDGDRNPADWATKPRLASELGVNSFWQRGPAFLMEDYSKWPIKKDFRVDRLEGEIQAKNVHVVLLASMESLRGFAQLLERVSHVQKLFNVVAYMFKWRSLRDPSVARIVPGVLTVKEIDLAKEFWIKYVQASEVEELKKSVSDGSGKIHGKYRRLAVFEDEKSIWRVGSRMVEFTPFTLDQKPPAFLPRHSKFTVLLMEKAHRRKHSGVEETVAQFRLQGYWTTQASKLAKKVKSECITCRRLDKKPMIQEMGNIPKDLLVNQVAWGHVEMDLFGPFSCRSEVNKRATKKVWGLVIVDCNSGAVHCDIVLDYSAEETLKALRRFASLRGWPSVISSDPGSQLESSSGRLESWWNTMRDQLAEYATGSRFEWRVSPAKSPWRQGRSEVRIKVIKRLLQISVGPSRLTPSELQTVLFEAANLTNERPIGVNRTPNSDGSFTVITPNSLLLGRSLNSVPDDAELAAHLKKSDRYELVQHITSEFWKQWVKQVVPEKVIRQKWHDTGRNLKVGDIVLVHGDSPLKGKYLLGIVSEVKEGSDKLVRSCSVTYTVPSQKDPYNLYSGGKKVTVSRSVQRLSLLLPIEEQSCHIRVKGNKLVKIDIADRSYSEDLVAEDRMDHGSSDFKHVDAEERTIHGSSDEEHLVAEERTFSC